MRKLLTLILLAGPIGGGWWFFQHYEVRGLENVKVVPRGAANTAAAEHDPFSVFSSFETSAAADPAQPPVRTSEKIRIASFNIQVFGDSKSSKPHVMEKLAQIVRSFDVVAVQEIRTQRQDLLPRFIELINATGRQYDYAIGPRLGRTSNTEQYAFIFDRETIEIDRSQIYTIDDPDDLLHREPMVAGFRVRGPPSDQAFTFTLVDLHTDPDEVTQEVDVLDDVMRIVRDDGRGEDDVILLGDFNADCQHLGQLGETAGVVCAISAIDGVPTPTNTRGTQQYDNLVFHEQATREFTGLSGVVDLVRKFNLSIDEALEISDHMPVWAEFSAYEGGKPGHIARLTDSVTR